MDFADGDELGNKLGDEGVQSAGTGSRRDDGGHVLKLITHLRHFYAGDHVLAVVGLRESADGLECRPPVDRRRADADRGADGISGWLDEPVEQLLGRAGGPLEPAQGPVGGEVLGRLHDADVGGVEVGHEFG